MYKNWQSHVERGNPFSLWLICFIANYLGRSVARLLLLPITLYYLLTAQAHCRASRNYLRRVLQREPSQWDVARHIHCFASTILDRVFFATDKIDLFDIEISGEEIIEQLRDQQQGCILLGAHFGSFDALRALAIGHQQLPLKVLMYPDQNVVITHLITELNPELADAIIPLGEIDTLIRAKDTIAQGGMVGILADRTRPGENQADCQFLGGNVGLPLGPLAMVDYLQVPLILCLAVFEGGNKYRIILESLPSLEKGNRSNRYERSAKWMKIYAKQLEAHVRDTPFNWFNFYDYWGDEKSG